MSGLNQTCSQKVSNKSAWGWLGGGGASWERSDTRGVRKSKKCFSNESLLQFTPPSSRQLLVVGSVWCSRSFSPQSAPSVDRKNLGLQGECQRMRLTHRTAGSLLSFYLGEGKGLPRRKRRPLGVISAVLIVSLSFFFFSWRWAETQRQEPRGIV